ncbi:hypothetical protein CTA1_11552 [Colletotrichum tanaceti]|uniref:Uncharacterized protein n=1 Tax=Colletotrichum tanaceti TaxID=1306861 RepID=A0A4U6XDT8_9PEZI|nr:hypothetical protein CTA1_11552 [Colletotrichum tanaceti]
MCASYSSPGADKATRWELSSGGSTPRSDTSTNMNSLFSSPGSPADTELSFPSVSLNDGKKTSATTTSNIAHMPAHPNHILAGNVLYTIGQVRAMSDTLSQARKTGEFPNTTTATEDAQSIVEDYQLLQRLRDARGDPASPPSANYNILKVDIARRIKARDEAHGGSSNLEEMDHRVQTWMNSINKEARMLEITQAALQRKGINNPTQDDLDAIAEEFMQIAERTLLDVANPLRMNATRMEGNISRFDSQLNGLSSLDGAMTAQLHTLNSVLSTLQSTVGNSVAMSADAMSASTDAMSTAMGAQINTLNTVLASQSTAINGSVNMLSTAINTVKTDLQQITDNLPTIIAMAVQAAVREQLSSVSHQHDLDSQNQGNFGHPPGYATATWPNQNQQYAREVFTGAAAPIAATSQVLGQQQHKQDSHLNTVSGKSKLKRFFRCIMGKGRSEKKGDHKEASLVMAPQQKNATKASRASKSKAPQAGIQKSRSTQNKKSGTKTSTQPTVPATDPITSNDAEEEGESSWIWTEVPPTKKQTAMNGRQRGRNLVQWNRKQIQSNVNNHTSDFDYRTRHSKNDSAQSHEPEDENEDEVEGEGEGNEAHRSFSTGPQIKREMNQGAMMGQQNVPSYPQDYSMAAQQIESQHPQQMLQAPQTYQAPWGPAPPGTVNPMDLRRESNSPIFADESQRNSKSYGLIWLTEHGHIPHLIPRTPGGDFQVQPNDLQRSGRSRQASFGPVPYSNMIPNNQFSYNYNSEGMGMTEAGRASGSHVNSAQNDPFLNGPTFSTSNVRE